MAGPTTLYQTGVHGSRPAASAGCVLYWCTSHALMYRSDGSTWATFQDLSATGGGGVATDTIWDATGDLAVGSGANTAAKLTIGSTGAYLHVASGTAAWGHPSGSYVQIVRANATGSDDTTTSNSLQASSLSAAITPKYSDSIIEIQVGGEVNISRASGSPLERSCFVAIRNTTNSVTVSEVVRGVNLVATSSAAGSTYAPIALHGWYTVNSTSSRTFQLQFRAVNASGETTVAVANARTGGTWMILREIRA